MPVTSVPNDKELEIHQDWFVSDLESVEDCDKAILYLTTAIASVEQQLELFARDPNSNREWVGRARYARRMQLTALEACRMRRQRFAKEQRGRVRLGQGHKCASLNSGRTLLGAHNMSQHITSPQLKVIALIAHSVEHQPQDWQYQLDRIAERVGYVTKFHNASMNTELIISQNSVVVGHTTYEHKQGWFGTRLKPVQRIMTFPLSNPHALAVSKHFNKVRADARKQRDDDAACAVLAALKGGAA